jgi:hypothetical protein
LLIALSSIDTLLQFDSQETADRSNAATPTVRFADGADRGDIPLRGGRGSTSAGCYPIDGARPCRCNVGPASGQLLPFDTARESVLSDVQLALKE